MSGSRHKSRVIALSKILKKGKCALTLRRHLTPPDVNKVTFRAVSAMVGTTPTPD